MKILKDVCSLVTAPFVEDCVARYAVEFAARRRLEVSRDRAGNLLIELRGSQPKLPRWVFTAHMDHPGFVAERMVDDSTLLAAFRGTVYADYLPGQRVRFCSADGQSVRGTVIDAAAEFGGTIAKSARVRVPRPVPAGAPGMFEQGEGRIKGSKFYSRAIDDLGGLAGALEMLDRLRRNPPRATAAVLLTRAEEEGFIGAIAACKQPKLLRKSDRLVAIECSAMQPYARQGDGCIIRVGDRTSIFHSGLTYFLTDQAETLAKRDKSFKFQRALMPGGTCEATVYDAWGYLAASICVPLGNYHNMDREKKRIGPEYIDANDWQSMVKLFVAVARNGHTYGPGHAALKQRLEQRFEKLRHLLA